MNNSNKGYTTAFTNVVREASTKQKILGVIALILVIGLIIYAILYLWRDFSNASSNEPWLIPTTRVANGSPKVIPGHVIKRSNDSRYGIEFTYTFWIYINNWRYKEGEWKNVFSKGNAGNQPDSTLLQAPGVWIYPNINKMGIFMNTFHEIRERCDIDNLPLQKWFHVTISCIGKNLDVYINGRLKKRCILKGIPKQNFGDLFVGLDGGFDGFLSKMRYFNYAIPYYKIEQMISDGPSKAPCEQSGAKPPYLANDWWFGLGYPDRG